MSKPIYLAIASPKGGVGKTSLTVLSASILHYQRGCDVAVVDATIPSIPSPVCGSKSRKN